MDPDNTLEEILTLAHDATEYDDLDATQMSRLAELILALDEWVVKGGFLPTRWNRGIIAADPRPEKPVPTAGSVSYRPDPVPGGISGRRDGPCD